MATNKYILALDQGTTSSRAAVVRPRGPHRSRGATGISANPPRSWNSRARSRGDLGLATRRSPQGMAPAGLYADDIAAIGVTNQRETTILWDRETGQPVANAIVWQSRVGAGVCDRVKADGLEPLVRAKTGLSIDAYFSGSKIKHLLDTHEGLRDRAGRGEILFGTVDTWLIWRLTGGRLPPHRFQQCHPHHVIQHPHARIGTTNCWPFSTFPGRCCPRFARPANFSAKLCPSTSEGQFPSPASSAISRRRPSARRASSRAAPRTLTAPAASCC